MTRQLFVVALAAVAISACGSSSSTTSAPATVSGAPASPPDVCAGDSWVPQLLGQRPELSSTMFLEQMKRAPAFGSYGAKMDSLEGDSLYELKDANGTISERYEFKSQPNSHPPLIVVIRNAFGDPRTLKEGNTFLYGPPVTIGNNILEYPPSAEAAAGHVSFRPAGGRYLYTFPEGTWVRVDAWMAQRVRTAFAAGPPPRPASAPDVAWEVCMNIDDYSHVWGVKPDRGVLRIHASGPPDLEMVYRLPTPALAIQAEGEQRVRCSGPQANKNNKGIFDIIPPCGSISSSTVDGVFFHVKARSLGLLR